MPLEVVDARTEEGVPRAMRGRTLWEGPEFTKHVSAVRRVVEDVRQRGDEALCDYSKQVYGAELGFDDMIVDLDERDAAAARVDAKVLDALERAVMNIRAFHEAQMPADWTIDRDGAVVGQVFRP